MTKMLIIAANYVDRSDKQHRYLVREPGQSVEDATYCESIRVEGPVEIKLAGELEGEWGCTRVMVANADHVKMSGIKGTEIEFNGYEFAVPGSERVLKRVNGLDLANDGTMTAVLIEEEVDSLC